MSGPIAYKRHKPGEGADTAGPPFWPAWNYDTKLYKIYAKQIKDAFSEAIRESSDHITAWWRGELTTTRQGLLHLISDNIEKAVGKVLYLLWTEAYFLGDRSAEAVAAHKAPNFGSWSPGRPGEVESSDVAGHIQHLLDAYGISLIQSIASTRMRELGEAISNAVARGEKPEELITRMPKILLSEMRADSIARTETMRGISAAAVARYKRMGATHKIWELTPRACQICRNNHQDGLIPLDSLYTSGDFSPPAHPGCRCATGAHIPTLQERLDKGRRNSRRSLRPLPNVTDGTYHSEPGAGYSGGNVQHPPNPSGPGWGGGGQQMHPHDATGTQYEDIPGASWGMEPPRWDYGMAGPGGAFANGDLNRVPGMDIWPELATDEPPEAWTHGLGRNPGYPSDQTGRPRTDMTDGSDPHPREDEEDEDEDEDNDNDYEQDKYPQFHRGRAPNAVGKGKNSKPWKDTSLPIDERIYRQLRDDYPPKAINWIRHVTWKEPQKIPTAKIDYSNEEDWKASHHGDRVNAMAEKITKKENGGKHSKPMVLVKSPGNNKYVVIDGHHRALAYRKTGIPAWGYIALVSKNKGPWLNTHHMQNHDSGDVTGSKDLTKNAANYNDPNPVEAEHVMNQMRINFPEDSIKWMKNAHWTGPVKVPLDRVDFDDIGRWAAFHQQDHVENFRKLIQRGDNLHPVIAVQVPGENKVKIVDGHHRALAYRELNKPVVAYVGTVHSKEGPWDKTHLYQIHQGSDPENKGKDKDKDKRPRAAGIVVQARDTGRVLMLQRHLHD